MPTADLLLTDGEERRGWWGVAGSKARPADVFWTPNQGAGHALRELSYKISHPVVRGGMGPSLSGGEVIEVMVMIVDSCWLLTCARY